MNQKHYRSAALAGIFMLTAAATANAGDVVITLADQNGAGYAPGQSNNGQGTSITVLGTGTPQISSGQSVTLDPGIYTIRAYPFPSLFRDFHGVEVTAATTTLDLLWESRSVSLRMVDQDDALLQGANVGMPFFPLVPNGGSVRLPINDSSFYPTLGYGPDNYRLDTHAYGINPTGTETNRYIHGNVVGDTTSVIQHEWQTVDVTLRLVDQDGVDISDWGATIGVTGFGTGPSPLTLKLPVNDTAIYPDLGTNNPFNDHYEWSARGISGSLMRGWQRWMDSPAQALKVTPGMTPEFTVEWHMQDVLLTAVDQNGNPFPEINGQRSDIIQLSVVSWPYPATTSGNTLRLPVNDPAIYPSLYGNGGTDNESGADGYDMRIRFDRHFSNTAKYENGTVITPTTTAVEVPWHIISGNLRVVDANENEVSGSTFQVTNPTGGGDVLRTTGDAVNLAITDDATYTHLQGGFATGYPIIVAPGDTAGSSSTTFEVMPNGDLLPQWVTIGGATYGLRIELPVVEPPETSIGCSSIIRGGLDILVPKVSAIGRYFDAGDLDGDGTPELLIGNSLGQGQLYQVKLDYPSKTILATQWMRPNFADWGWTENNIMFGRGISILGDIDGDGTADFVSAAPNHGSTGSGFLVTGPVWSQFPHPQAFGISEPSIAGMLVNGQVLFHGSNDRPVIAYGCSGGACGDYPGGMVYLTGQWPTPQGGGVTALAYRGLDITRFQQGDRFGNSVGCIGDFDGNGMPDLVVGARSDYVSGSQQGAAWIILFDSTWNVIGQHRIATGTDGMPNLPNGQSFGLTVAGIGDLDGDGTIDLAVMDAAKLHILFMKKTNGANGLDVTVRNMQTLPYVDEVTAYRGSIELLGPGCGSGGDGIALAVGVELVNDPDERGGIAILHLSGGSGLLVDSTSPVVTLTSPLDGAIFGSTLVSVAAEVVDDSTTDVSSDPVGIVASLPAGGGLVSGSLTLLQEGSNVIAVTAEDAVGNIGGGAVVVTVDTTDPTIVVSSPLDAAIFGTSPALLTVDVSDATETTVSFGANSIALPAGGGQATGSVSLNPGNNSIVVTCVDAAGNSSSETINVVLDTTAPIISIGSPLNGALFGPSDTIIALSATVDDLTATSVTSTPAGLSDSLPAGGGIAVGTIPLMEGSNPITIAVIDGAGRTSSAAITVTLDTTPPAVELTSPTEGSAISGEIDFDALVEDALPGSGVASVKFSIDGSLVGTVVAPPYGFVYDTQLLSDGLHGFTAVAYDGQGNGSSPVTSAVLVDNTPPVVAFGAPLDGGFVSNLADINVQVSDPGSGLIQVEVLVNGVPATVDPSELYALPVPSDSLDGAEDTFAYPDGTLGLTARAVDDAGNEALVEIFVTVDNTAPTRTLKSPTDGKRAKNWITLEACAQDANFALIEFLVDGVLVGSSTSSPFAMEFDTRTRLDGEMDVTAVVHDLAGNTASSTATVHVNNIKLELRPKKFDLKRKKHGQGNVGNANHEDDDDGIIARLEGPNVALVFPREAHIITLNVPGGSPIPALVGWTGDDEITGSGNNSRLRLRFDRTELLNAILAGMASGSISSNAKRVTTTLIVDGHVIGRVRMRLSKRQ